MRIAILGNVLPTAEAMGGAGRIAFVYAEQLRALGHEVKAFGPSPEFFELSQMDLVTRLAFHARELVRDSVKADEILDWEPDVLLTHNLTGCGFKTPRYVADAGVRWVHVLHDVQIFEPSGQMMAGESLPWMRWLWRVSWSLFRQSAMRDPHAVVSPTRWLIDVHKKHYCYDRGVPAFVIPNPVPMTSTTVTERKPSSILFAGRVDVDKGIRVLMEAWKHVAAPATLTIVGDGAERAAIEAIAMDRVTCLGAQSPSRVAELMRQHEVVVVPSLVMENQPTVILEALHAGCYVIATDVGGSAETVDGAGTLVPPNDARALAAAMQNAFGRTADPASVQRVLASHDPRACTERLLAVLRGDATDALTS